MTDWADVALADVADRSEYALATGPFGSAIGARHFIDRGVPVLRGSNLSLDIGERLVEDEMVFINAEKAREFRRSIARRGDLVFTCWGTVGQVGLIDERSQFDEYVVSNKQMKLTPDSRKVDSLYLYYALSAPRTVEAIRGEAIGSSVPGFNLGQLKQIRVPLPSLAEQKAIAEVLGALDDKIESNRRTIELLNALAEARFQEVQFRSGAIIHRLGDVATLRYGKALRKDNRRLGPVPVMGSVGQTGWHDEALIGGPVLIVGRKGHPGAVALSHAPCWPIDTAFYIEQRDGIPISWLYWALRHMDLGRLRADSAVPGLNREMAEADTIEVPSPNALAAFDGCVWPLMAHAQQLGCECRTLTALRDALLPELLSGRLRVPQAEEMVESVT